MPHHFVNRPRRHAMFGKMPTKGDQYRWELINAVLYELGGLLFVAGSLFFFPGMDTDPGAWIFFGGSLLYLLVTSHDMAEVCQHLRQPGDRPRLWNRLEAAASGAYLLGSLLFAAGSLLFLSTIALERDGAWCFIIGSLLFTGGAVVNVLQIVRASSLVTLQLMNLTALCFVTGSMLFAISSVPWLWTLSSDRIQQQLTSFLAWQYLLGSLLFLAGGIFNRLRVRILRKANKIETRSG